MPGERESAVHGMIRHGRAAKKPRTRFEFENYESSVCSIARTRSARPARPHLLDALVLHIGASAGAQGSNTRRVPQNSPRNSPNSPKFPSFSPLCSASYCGANYMDKKLSFPLSLQHASCGLIACECALHADPSKLYECRQLDRYARIPVYLYICAGARGNLDVEKTNYADVPSGSRLSLGGHKMRSHVLSLALISCLPLQGRPRSARFRLLGTQRLV
jgi:hypothetical protein